MYESLSGRYRPRNIARPTAMRVGRAGPRSLWTHRLLQYVIAAASAQDGSARLELARLLRFGLRFDGGMHVNRAHAAVKTDREKEHGRERQASNRDHFGARTPEEEKSRSRRTR